MEAIRRRLAHWLLGEQAQDTGIGRFTGRAVWCGASTTARGTTYRWRYGRMNGQA